jgi:hypothetical protein
MANVVERYLAVSYSNAGGCKKKWKAGTRERGYRPGRNSHAMSPHMEKHKKKRK